MILYTIGFTQQEKDELLELFKENPKWRKRIKEAGSTLLSDPMFTYSGCADSGFCFNCNIIVGDTTCFCAGGLCPLCHLYVAPNTIPKDLTGYYHKHTNCEVILQEYKDGKWVGTFTKNE